MLRGCGQKKRRLGGEPALLARKTCQQLGIPLGRFDAEFDPDGPGEAAPLGVAPILSQPVAPDRVEPAPMLLEPVEPAAEPDAPAPLEAEPLLAESEPSEDRLSPRTRFVAWSQHCVP